jgi:hypothetical protein
MKQLEIQHAAVSAILVYREKPDEGLARLRETADADDRLGKHPVSPGAIVPVRELLGDLLLEANRPKEALEAFEASLKLNPGRLAAISGAARAAEVAGMRDVATAHYRELVALTKSGDGRRAEVQRARAFLAVRSGQ